MEVSMTGGVMDARESRMLKLHASDHPTAICAKTNQIMQLLKIEPGRPAPQVSPALITARELATALKSKSQACE
ncbi:MAG TPA: hypothetical protein ENN39_04645 [Desulfonatronum sp.]|nr:hypothetical protein [Desulfonatronum sp.]